MESSLVLRACTCECAFEGETVKVRRQLFPTLSLFLLRPEPAVSAHETKTMGQLIGEAYYGLKTQHI